MGDNSYLAAEHTCYFVRQIKNPPMYASNDLWWGTTLVSEIHQTHVPVTAQNELFKLKIKQMK